MVTSPMASPSSTTITSIMFACKRGALEEDDDGDGDSVDRKDAVGAEDDGGGGGRDNDGGEGGGGGGGGGGGVSVTPGFVKLMENCKRLAAELDEILTKYASVVSVSKSRKDCSPFSSSG